MIGFDLTTHYEDISKIVRAKFPVKGSEADDLVQEVCKKIVKLNNTSPYDSEKSSISHYIYMVASGVFRSGLRKKKRSPLAKSVSMIEEINEGDRTTDTQDEVIDFGLLSYGGLIAEFIDYVEETLDEDDLIPRRLLMLTSMGYTKKEIAQILKVSFYRVDQDRKRLKDMAKKWMRKYSS